jgi:hypothetical protein
MALMDALFQQLSTVQDDKQPTPPTVTAAATISPTTFLTVLAGNTAVATINPPVPGVHMLAFLAGTTTGFTNTGNIVGGTTTVAGRVYLFVFNPLTDASYTTVGGHYMLVSSTTT